MNNKINAHYIFTLYNKVKKGDNIAIDKLIEIYFHEYPLNYYEVVELDSDNLEQMFLTLYKG